MFKSSPVNVNHGPRMAGLSPWQPLVAARLYLGPAPGTGRDEPTRPFDLRSCVFRSVRRAGSVSLREDVGRLKKKNTPPPSPAVSGLRARFVPGQARRRTGVARGRLPLPGRVWVTASQPPDPETGFISVARRSAWSTRRHLDHSLASSRRAALGARAAPLPPIPAGPTPYSHSARPASLPQRVPDGRTSESEEGAAVRPARSRFTLIIQRAAPACRPSHAPACCSASTVFCPNADSERAFTCYVTMLFM